MRYVHSAVFVVLVGASAGFTDCVKRDLDPVPVPGVDTRPVTGGPEVEPGQLAVFGKLPTTFDNPKNPITPAKTTLGQLLYHDTRLSKAGDISCATCHDLQKFGVDGKPTSTGHGGALGSRNAPTVYNIAGAVAQFWDGRAPDVEEQAKGPVLNPIEMAVADEAAVNKILKGVPAYAPLFKAAFPDDKDPVNFANMAKAVGAFERQLVTPGRFDRYLAGDKAALTAVEKSGLKKFIELGCTTCHNGPALGGTSFQKMGLVKPYESKDQGRFEVTKQEADRMMFRVPILRNIAETAPYFHDGSVKTLDEAIVLMARHQLGKDLSKEDVASIAAFLKTLTGELPIALAKRPDLPK